MEPILRLNDVENRVMEHDDIPETTKAELLRLLTLLKSEIAKIEYTHAEHAESVVSLAERSMHEAIRQPKNPQHAASALHELAESVAELEVSHPQLVNVVNAISILLSNIGI